MIIESFERHIKLTDIEKEKALHYFYSKKELPKTILLLQGEICKESYFVEEGILRSYSEDDTVAQHTLTFACKGWWISDLYSMFSQKPSQITIEIVKEAELKVLTRENREKLLYEMPIFERYFRILTENSLVANQQRIINKMMLSAEERYQKFIEKYGKLAYEIPQKHIASYIGVTPEFFSKMKAQSLKNR